MNYLGQAVVWPFFFAYIYDVIVKQEKVMKLVREFNCTLTGEECVVVLNAFNQEVCLLKSEYLEIKSNVAHDKRELEMEIG